MNFGKQRARQSGLVATLALVLALALSANAFAQESSAETYGGPSAQVLSGGGGSAGGPSADTAADGSLPFTGMDIGLALAGAVLLIGTGVAVSRLTVRKSQT